MGHVVGPDTFEELSSWTSKALMLRVLTSITFVTSLYVTVCMDIHKHTRVCALAQQHTFVAALDACIQGTSKESVKRGKDA